MTNHKCLFCNINIKCRNHPDCGCLCPNFIIPYYDLNNNCIYNKNTKIIVCSNKCKISFIHYENLKLKN